MSLCIDVNERSLSENVGRGKWWELARISETLGKKTEMHLSRGKIAFTWICKVLKSNRKEKRKLLNRNQPSF